jgi:hypothetical protein
MPTTIGSMPRSASHGSPSSDVPRLAAERDGRIGQVLSVLQVDDGIATRPVAVRAGQ